MSQLLIKHMKLPPLVVPEELVSPIAAIAAAGGTPWFVGGAVRDHLLGLEPKDYDVETFGLGMDEIAKALAPFGHVDIIGEAFGVVKLFINHKDYDFSVPRTEVKSGEGHQGFTVVPDPFLSLEAAAMRRDFTCNTIYFNPITEEYADPCDGAWDLNNGILRHASKAFSEDPLRVLRAFQFCSRFGFIVDPETVDICRSLKGEFHSLSKERVWMEWEKWATKSKAPELGLEFLRKCGWVEHFPGIRHIMHIRQEPTHHPEGDVWVHTVECLKAIRRLEEPVPQEEKLVTTLAVLCHDLGKIVCTQDDGNRITSHGHEAAGETIAMDFLKSINAPREISNQVVKLVGNHMLRCGDIGPKVVRRAAQRVFPATLQQLCWVMEADTRGRPPKPDVCCAKVRLIRDFARAQSLEKAPPVPIIKGRNLIDIGMQPSAEFGKILAFAMEGQLDGKFGNLSTGIIYLRENSIIPQ